MGTGTGRVSEVGKDVDRLMMGTWTGLAAAERGTQNTSICRSFLTGMGRER